MKHVAVTSDDSNDQSGAFTPDTCPFLRRSERQNTYRCTINDTKPFNCKNYPDDGVCEYATNLN